MKISNIEVTLLDKMGSDESVCNAARVSFDKTASEYSEEQNNKLIAYLAKHNHWSPFAHAFVQFRVKAPIFVARQLVKHQAGLVWNEVSRRYVSSEPEFYLPRHWRKSAANVKQGSSDEPAVNNEGFMVGTMEVVDDCLSQYQDLLNAGICAEQARMILPQNTMTEWIWSGSLYAFARVCNLRLDSHTQRETQEVAKLIDKAMKEIFPVSWEVLVK